MLVEHPVKTRVQGFRFERTRDRPTKSPVAGMPDTAKKRWHVRPEPARHDIFLRVTQHHGR